MSDLCVQLVSVVGVYITRRLRRTLMRSRDIAQMWVIYSLSGSADLLMNKLWPAVSEHLTCLRFAHKTIGQAQYQVCISRSRPYLAKVLSLFSCESVQIRSDRQSDISGGQTQSNSMLLHTLLWKVRQLTVNILQHPPVCVWFSAFVACHSLFSPIVSCRLCTGWMIKASKSKAEVLCIFQ